MTTPAIPIRADVPVDLHPDTLAPFAAALDREGVGGRGALAAAQEALADLYEFYAAAQHAERELHRLSPSARRRQHPDGTSEYLGDLRMVGGSLRSFHGHEEEFAAAAEQAFARAAKVADRRLKELKEHREGVAKRVAEAVDHTPGRQPVGISQAAEIRAHIKALPGEQRLALVQTALSAGDKQTVAAVLFAPAYLSGLSAEEMAGVRHAAERKFAPEDSAALGAVDGLIERVMRAGSLAVGRLAEAQKVKTAPQAQARKVLAALKHPT
jgi:hypothetical protein